MPQPTNKDNVYRKTQLLKELQTKALNVGNLERALVIERFIASVSFTKRIVVMAYINRSNAKFRNT